MHLPPGHYPTCCLHSHSMLNASNQSHCYGRRCNANLALVRGTYVPWFIKPNKRAMKRLGHPDDSEAHTMDPCPVSSRRLNQNRRPITTTLVTLTSLEITARCVLSGPYPLVPAHLSLINTKLDLLQVRNPVKTHNPNATVMLPLAEGSGISNRYGLYREH